jgi:hypothetical protein
MIITKVVELKIPFPAHSRYKSLRACNYNLENFEKDKG